LSLSKRLSSFTKYDIAFFIDENEKVRWSHLLKEFVTNDSERHISRQKLSDYLKELCDEGLVQKAIDKKALALRMLWRVYPIYIVPKKRRKKLMEIKDKKEIFDFIDSASPEEITKLKEEVARINKLS
jgi:hypothetical protein